MKIISFLKNLISEGWKQKEIAEKCGYTPTHICKILKTEHADIVTIEKIAKAFGKPVSMFLDEENPERLIPSDREELLLQQIREEGLLDEALRWVEKEKLYKNVKKESAA